MGKLTLKGMHRLLCGDATKKTDVDTLMVGEKAEILFTSPPYSDLRDYSGDLALDPRHLANFLDFPAKTYFVNLGLIIRDREIIRYWDAYLDAATNRGMKLLAWNVWDRGNARSPGKQQAMFGLCHEWIFAFGEYRKLNLTVENSSEVWGTPSIREKDGSLTKRRHGKLPVRRHRQLDSVIPVEPQKNYAADWTGHPAAFPVSLPLEYIEAASQVGDLVAEPFAGSGTTVIACEKAARRCYAMEIDPAYCDLIINRFIKTFGKRVVRRDGMEWES